MKGFTHEVREDNPLLVKPAGNYCMIELHEIEEKTAGGIWKAVMRRDHNRKVEIPAKLISMGPRPAEDTKKVPLGSRVWINGFTHPFAEWSWKDKDYWVVKTEDIDAFYPSTKAVSTHGR